MSRLMILAGALLSAVPALAQPLPARARLDFGTASLTSAPAFWVFLLFAVLALGGAVFTITRRNAIMAVVGLIGTFFALAGIYVLLYAHFLAVMQVLIYAGAIMVLFIFVIMILGREETEPWALRSLVTKALGVVAILFVGYVLWRVTRAPMAIGAPPPPGFGTVEAFGDLVFKDYLFPFEAVSLLLLLAVIGAVVIARGRPKNPAGAATAPPRAP